MLPFNQSMRQVDVHICRSSIYLTAASGKLHARSGVLHDFHYPKWLLGKEIKSIWAKTQRQIFMHPKVTQTVSAFLSCFAKNCWTLKSLFCSDFCPCPPILLDFYIWRLLVLLSSFLPVNVFHLCLVGSLYLIYINCTFLPFHIGLACCIILSSPAFFFPDWSLTVTCFLCFWPSVQPFEYSYWCLIIWRPGIWLLLNSARTPWISDCLAFKCTMSHLLPAG